MSRLYTFSRFAEPSARDNLAECSWCGVVKHHELLIDDPKRDEYRCIECQEEYLAKKHEQQSEGMER